MISYFPVVTGSLVVLGNVSVSGSINTSGSITISGSITSASFASTASFVALAQSASNAVSAQTASFANTLTVAGNLTAQTLVVQTITSSVDFVTGSTRFGSILGNTHVFSGSVTMNPGGLFVSSSGLVGIGMTPNRTLDVTGTFRVVTPNRSFFVTSNAYSISDGTLSSGIGMDGDGLYLGNVTSATGWTISNPQVTIRSSGNIGIGSTDPGALLVLRSFQANTSNYAWLTFRNGGGGYGTWGFFKSGSNDLSLGYSTDTDTPMNNATAVTFKYGGNIGIGTSSPGYLLEVAGFTRTQNLRVTTDIYLERTAVSPAIVLDQSDIRFVNQATGVSNTLSTISGGLQCNNAFFANVGTSAMGLGSITNRRRVQWDDSLDEMMVLGSNNGYKPVGAAGFNTRSDYRLKEDLQDSNGLEKIKSIKTYNFKWIETGERQDGVIAHELAEILPYAVNGNKDGINENGDPSYQGVDYSKLVPVLVKAIQELNTKFEEYKATHP